MEGLQTTRADSLYFVYIDQFLIRERLAGGLQFHCPFFISEKN